MPTSKKPRKPAPKGGVQALLKKANAARHARYGKLNDRIRLKNNVPLAHPLNAWKLDKTFKPLVDVLADQDKTGTLLADEIGRPMLWDEDDQEYSPLVPSVLHMAHVFDVLAGALVWGKQPPGLRAFALKLSRDEKIVAGDTDDARETLLWMRERIGKLTPAQWTEHFTAAVNRIDEQDARESA